MPRALVGGGLVGLQQKRCRNLIKKTSAYNPKIVGFIQGRLEEPKAQVAQVLLGGSWVVVSGVISRVTIVIAYSSY